MVPEPGQQGIGEALVVGTAADIEVALRAYGIPVKLLPQDNPRDKQAGKAGEKDIAKSFFTHRAEIFCKDIKNSYFCARVSLIRPAPTESPRRGIEQGYVVVAVRYKELTLFSLCGARGYVTRASLFCSVAA